MKFTYLVSGYNFMVAAFLNTSCFRRVPVEANCSNSSFTDFCAFGSLDTAVEEALCTFATSPKDRLIRATSS